MGSLSDSCNSVLATYFDDIYEHLKKYFVKNEVCILAGECTSAFHSHDNIEITPLSDLGYVQVP